MNNYNLQTEPLLQGKVQLKKASHVDELVRVGIYGVTSDEALNGATEFVIEVLPANATLSKLIQRQLVYTSGLVKTNEREYDNGTFSDWFLRENSTAVGYSYFDEASGKPLWLASNSKAKAFTDFMWDGESEVLSAGNITITIGNTDFVVPVVEGTGFFEDNIEAILAYEFAGYTVSAIQEGIQVGFRLTATTYGIKPEPTFVDTDTTGLVLELNFTQGADYVWVDATGTEV